MNWNRRQRGYGSERSFEEYLQDMFDRPGTLLFIVLAVVIGSGVFSSYFLVRPQEKESSLASEGFFERRMKDFILSIHSE